MQRNLIYWGEPAAQPQDSYVKTIQDNSNVITREVTDLVKTEGALDNLVYWQNCDTLLGTVRGQNLEAEQGYSTILDNHRDINVKYRAFLHEAAGVILICEATGKPYITKMNAAEAALY